MTDYSDSDVKLLAETVLDYWQTYDDCDNGPNGYNCEFCTGEHDFELINFKHALDCPVLVAQDVLTIGKKERKRPIPPGHIKKYVFGRGFIETEESIQANKDWINRNN